MTKEEFDKILSTGKLKRVKSKHDFPHRWYSAMGLSGMSEVDGPFAGGCTEQGPRERMVLGAFSEEYGLLIYEQGGLAHWVWANLYQHLSKNAKPEQVYMEDVGKKDGTRVKEIEMLLV